MLVHVGSAERPHKHHLRLDIELLCQFSCSRANENQPQRFELGLYRLLYLTNNSVFAKKCKAKHYRTVLCFGVLTVRSPLPGGLFLTSVKVPFIRSGIQGLTVRSVGHILSTVGLN